LEILLFLVFCILVVAFLQQLLSLLVQMKSEPTETSYSRCKSVKCI